MNHTRLWVVATIIAVIILAGFALSVPHTQEVIETSPSFMSSASIPSVTLHDVFKKGMHTIVGSIAAPDACVTVSAAATLESGASGTSSILVDVTMPDEPGVCLERSSTERFSVTVAAPQGLPIMVRVNGVTATTTEI